MITRTIKRIKLSVEFDDPQERSVAWWQGFVDGWLQQGGFRDFVIHAEASEAAHRRDCPCKSCHKNRPRSA